VPEKLSSGNSHNKNNNKYHKALHPRFHSPADPVHPVLLSPNDPQDSLLLCLWHQQMILTGPLNPKTNTNKNPFKQQFWSKKATIPWLEMAPMIRIMSSEVSLLLLLLLLLVVVMLAEFWRFFEFPNGGLLFSFWLSPVCCVSWSGSIALITLWKRSSSAVLTVREVDNDGDGADNGWENLKKKKLKFRF
jgi:hypothetical protein